MNCITKLAGIMVIAGAMSSSYATTTTFVGTETVQHLNIIAGNTGDKAVLGNGSTATLVTATDSVTISKDLELKDKATLNLKAADTPEVVGKPAVVDDEGNVVTEAVLAQAAVPGKKLDFDLKTNLILNDSAEIVAGTITNTGTIKFVKSLGYTGLPKIAADIKNGGTLSGPGIVTGKIYLAAGFGAGEGGVKQLQIPTPYTNLYSSYTDAETYTVAAQIVEMSDDGKNALSGDVLKSNTDTGTTFSQDVNLSYIDKTDDTVTYNNLPAVVVQICTGKSGYTGALKATESATNFIPVTFNNISEDFTLGGDNSNYKGEAKFIASESGKTLIIAAGGQLPGGNVEVGTTAKPMDLNFSTDSSNPTKTIKGSLTVNGNMSIGAGMTITATAAVTATKLTM